MKNILRLFCGAGVYVFLFFLVLVYSLYAPEGYIQIATNKYLFYRKLCLITAAVMIPSVLLYYMAPPHHKGVRRVVDNISATDIFVLLYLLVNIISFVGTECGKEMTEGFLQGNTNSLFFNMERQKSAVCGENGVCMAQGRLRPADFGGFICKECGIVVFQYKNSLK